MKKKISEKGAVRAGKGFTLFNWNEDINDIIKIIKSLEDSVNLMAFFQEIVYLE